jgi:hypothetical protein
MRKASLLVFVVLTALGAACESSSPNGGSFQSIHPQPQPNAGSMKFTAPCTAATCGSAPETLASPHCKPEASGCGWSEDTPVSYRPCAESECGQAPSADTCPSGTTFKGNTCGSENDAACTWSSVCLPPRSTIACADVDGCGPKPEIAVVCQDGGTGDLACMQVASRCAWQRTCD